MATELFYDWNRVGTSLRQFVPKLVDETLRDGLQSPSATDPPLGRKLELLRSMAELGIDCVALGYAASRPRQGSDALALARCIESERLGIEACCAARALPEDIRPILEIADEVGIPIQVGLFIGSSPIRQYVQSWDLDQMLALTERAVGFAVRHGLEVLYVAEDATRSRPDTLEQLCRTAVRSGARRVCLADTVGQATPEGAAALVRFVRSVLDECDPRVQIDWHGHSDRGLALAASLAAWQAGAERCHGTALGIGERSGNTPMELLLVSLAVDGYRERGLSSLPAYVARAARALGVAIPPNQPVVGRDAFRTGTGTHAAALRKAEELGDAWLADRIYSSVPATLVGRRQSVAIGPLSGEANVLVWLAERGVAPEPGLVAALLAAAKASDRLLSDAELEQLLPSRSARPASGTETTASARSE